jgi:excisionase family DNA binding protein
MLPDPNPGPEDDPWLTLAEIAEELRMSPATIRSWISKGTLRATRAGQRKWLVRRSELDRMIAGKDVIGPEGQPGGPGWRINDTIEAPHRSPHWSEEAREHVSRGGWLGVAETEWREALRASALAPPDPGFVVRINEIADAAARKAAALDNLGDEAPGPWWQRQSGLPSGVLSYELRPGANRPGPAELWARFDRAVEQLGLAMSEHSAPAEQIALEEVSLVLHEIVDALLEAEGREWPPPDEGQQDGRDGASREAGDA